MKIQTPLLVTFFALLVTSIASTKKSRNGGKISSSAKNGKQDRALRYFGVSPGRRCTPDEDERNTLRRICPYGTTCRHNACNCDDLKDGTVMYVADAFRPESGDIMIYQCKRLIGQKCTKDRQCDMQSECVNGKCKCKPGFSECIYEKIEAKIEM